MDLSLYQSKMKFPEIKVESKNLYYAEILLRDYAGKNSELTAITQYLYHSFDNDNNYSKIADILEKISIVEMKHLDVLSKLIIELGGKPVYFTNEFGCWNSSFVEYGYTLENQLRKDLNDELTAINNYRKHQEIIEDINIKQILEKIISDEEVHVKILTDLLKNKEIIL